MRKGPALLTLIVACAALLALLLPASPASQAPKPTSLAQTLREFRWKKRVLLVAAPRPEQADFQAQKQLLAPVSRELAERDILVLDVLYHRLSAADRQYLTRKTGVRPLAFAAVLIGKDGGVKLTSARPLAPAALFAAVDQMPMRQDELRRP